MSTPEQHAAFVAGFMADYFAEADEHIVAVQRDLLRLESALGRDLPTAVVDELFRSVHSLKGISAMVEIHDAEQIAHHMESLLRDIRQGQRDLTPASFDTLVDGANLLEQVIAARRTGTPAPSIAGGLEALVALEASADDGARRVSPPIASNAGAPGPALTAPTWKVTFVPSPALIARGIKVDAIRNRLLEIGRVLNVAPRVSPGGGIAFEFQVQTDAEDQLAAWRDDGLTYEPMPAAAGGSRPAGGGEFPSAGPRGLDEPVPAQANYVRVDLARLDNLMRLVGDLVVARARVEGTLQQVEGKVPASHGRAHRQIVLTAVPRQEGLESGQKHHEERRAFPLAKNLCQMGELGRQPHVP